MKLREILKQTMLYRISNANLNWILGYARDNNKAIAWLYSKGIINDKEIELALKDALIKTARSDYQRMLKNKCLRPDHDAFIEGLAYALENGEFSKREIKKIPFDHGYDAEKFKNSYGKKDLLKNLRETLLNPAPFPSFEGKAFDEHFVCLEH